MIKFNYSETSHRRVVQEREFSIWGYSKSHKPRVCWSWTYSRHDIESSYIYIKKSSTVFFFFIAGGKTLIFFFFINLLTTILRDNWVDRHQQDKEDRSHIDNPLSRLSVVTRHCTQYHRRRMLPMTKKNHLLSMTYYHWWQTPFFISSTKKTTRKKKYIQKQQPQENRQILLLASWESLRVFFHCLEKFSSLSILHSQH